MDLFRLVDKDGGGTISMDEFLELLQSMSVRPSIHEMQLLYEEIDENGNGSIELGEFMAFMDDSRMGNKVGRDELFNAFAMFEGFAGSGADSSTTGGNGSGTAQHKDNHVRSEDVMAAIMEYASDHIHVGRTERTTVTEDRRERAAKDGSGNSSSNSNSRASVVVRGSGGSGVSDVERRGVVDGLLRELPWSSDGYLNYRQFVVDNTKERVGSPTADTL